ncbi:MAG: glycosyltransferase family 4 protein [Parachlamydiaceae bacterium]|nr:glycosyltransferase family 4 protein [Parachlamydiaceae bacterium]
MSNIIIYSPSVIGKSMAGPSIRAWEFAKALSKYHHTILVSPNDSDIEDASFKVICKSNPLLKEYEKKADVMIVQDLPFTKALFAKQNGIKLIIDAYDPLPLEYLELPFGSAKEAKICYHDSITALNFRFRMADGIICASEKQRDLWLGLLMSQKLITPELYKNDNSLRDFIDVVPFGISSIPPKKTGTGFREKYGFKNNDKILLWGGGIWNWFDPLTLIKAIKLLSESRSDIKLVFMGIKSPDRNVPEMAMSVKAIELAKDLDLLNKSVFFNHGWIPYEERHNYLLDSDIGVSTHFNHLETRFAFRTRILDCIWASLPIVATEGDSFGDLIQQQTIGITVPHKDEKALANAIISILDQPNIIKEMKSNLLRIQNQFHWENVVEPIKRMIENNQTQPKPIWRYDQLQVYSNFVWKKLQKKAKCKLIKLFSKNEKS